MRSVFFRRFIGLSVPLLTKVFSEAPSSFRFLCTEVRGRGILGSSSCGFDCSQHLCRQLCELRAHLPQPPAYLLVVGLFGRSSLGLLREVLATHAFHLGGGGP
jgi:hypothetical protein